MPITPPGHLDRQTLMPPVERPQPSFPAKRLGMTGIPFLMLRKNHPYSMEFSVFAQKMGPAESSGRDVPDPHKGYYGLTRALVSNYNNSTFSLPVSSASKNNGI